MAHEECPGEVDGVQGPQARCVQSADRNIILVGMPGAGKSTLGVMLAKRLAMNFVDTDVVIQVVTGRSLQTVLEDEGYLGLRAVEERTILATDFRGHVVATGGSAVYSASAMVHLRRNGTVVFLDLPLATIASRVSDLGARGVACRPGQTLAELYEERVPLYRAVSDVTVAPEGLAHEATCDVVIGALKAATSMGSA